MKKPPTPSAPPTEATPESPPALFVALRDLLRAHEAALLVVHDDDGHFYANCRTPDRQGKPPFFGAVKVSGRRHAFHFMPIYDFPELLDGISPALKKRMQGKSCFTFEAYDPALLHEMQRLIQQGVARYTAAGKL